MEAEKILSELTTLIPVIEMNAAAGACYGEIQSVLEKAGRLIGNNDLWIAAHALALGVPLVTNNESEFSRVPGLAVQNWLRPQSGIREKQSRYAHPHK